jgi:hypothetical protein
MPVTHQFMHHVFRILEKIFYDPFDLASFGQLGKTRYGLSRGGFVGRAFCHYLTFKNA